MNQIPISIQKFSRMVDTIFEDKLSDSGLSRGQYVYIDYLFHNDGANQYDISRDLFIDKTTVAKALKKLETSKIVNRKTDSRDKRKVNVHLTSTGKTLYQEVTKAMEEINEIFDKNIDPEIVAKLDRIVDVFVQELDIVWCDIKNYKRKSVYSIATASDIAQLHERNALDYYDENLQLYVERFGQYVINWIVFRRNEKSDDVYIVDIHFHHTADVIISGMELIRAFEDYYNLNFSGKIYVEIDEKRSDLQKLLHKNSYLFHSYTQKANEKSYVYQK